MKLASKALPREKKLLRQVYDEIEIALNALLLEIQNGETPTRTELWRSNKYLQLRAVIEKQLEIDAQHQIDILDTILPQVFEDVIERSVVDFKNDAAATPLQRKAVIDTAWSGSNYSTRIWKNSNATAAHLEKDITDLIVLGKNPSQIKAKIRDDLGVSYREASRLLRTESAYIYSQAAIEGYKSSGVKKVKYLHGGHCICKNCDCEELNGKIFDIGTEPTIPRHPNCVCCYAPVIETGIK